jgi:hypothetical protein
MLNTIVCKVVDKLDKLSWKLDSLRRKFFDKFIYWNSSKSLARIILVLISPVILITTITIGLLVITFDGLEMITQGFENINFYTKKNLIENNLSKDDVT